MDHARHRSRDKRGGSVTKLSLDEARAVAAPENQVDLLALDEALTSLAAIDPKRRRIYQRRPIGRHCDPASIWYLRNTKGAGVFTGSECEVA